MAKDYDLQLKRFRTENGLSQQKLADAVGFSRRQIQSWESGEADMPIEYAPQICEYFCISLDELAGIADTEDEEQRLVSMFRRLTADQRATVLAMVEGLVR